MHWPKGNRVDWARRRKSEPEKETNVVIKTKMMGKCKSLTDEDGFDVDAHSMKTRMETRTRSRGSKDLEFGSNQIWFAWMVLGDWTAKTIGRVIVELPMHTVVLGSPSVRGGRQEDHHGMCN